MHDFENKSLKLSLSLLRPIRRGFGSYD